MSNADTRRVALITGASSGIGQTCALHLATRGWRVFGAQRRPAHAELANAGIEPVVMDVEQNDSVEEAVRSIMSKTTRLDAVVNNAGTLLTGPVEETSDQEARSQLETNFLGVLRVCRAVLPILRSQASGHIVNISSLAGIVGVPFSGLYSASKFAVEGMSQALRLETSRFGIHVSVIEPGNFRTELTTRRQAVAALNATNAYTNTFQSYRAVQDREEAAAPTPERIASLLERVLNSSRPKFRYPVARLHQRMMVPLLHLLPQRIFERMLCKVIGIPTAIDRRH